VAWTLARLANEVGGRVVGDPDRKIRAIATLETAGPDDLGFLTSEKYAGRARKSAAGALLVVSNPSAALARLITLMHPAVVVQRPGVHETAVLGRNCRVDATAHLGPYVVLGDAVTVGADAVVEAHSVIGTGCRVGDRCRLHAHVVLYPGVELAEGVEIHSGAVLGADGFGYASAGEELHKIPQVGSVEIGADVEIGALSAVDRAVLGATRIGAGTKIDNLVQVGHNSQVGSSCILCGQAGLAGSAKLGDGVVLAGQAGVGEHAHLGDGSRVAGQSLVAASLAPGKDVAGSLAVDIADWRRQQAALRRLPALLRRVQTLERAADGEAPPVREDEEETS
jgi:UDP-3-O-[3-hydroxymyristoyl] glucosamine N-acyltransferase